MCSTSGAGETSVVRLRLLRARHPEVARRSLSAGFRRHLAERAERGRRILCSDHCRRAYAGRRDVACGRRFAGMLWTKQFYHSIVDGG